MVSPEEEWRPIPGWEDCYEVSNIGRVRSLDRVVQGKIGLRTQLGRLMRQTINRSGYPRVMLQRDKVYKTMLIHRLVALAFIGPPPTPAHQHVNHKNGDRADPKLENLEWATPSENLQHAYDVLGRPRAKLSGARGEKARSVKLSDEQVEDIRRRCAAGEVRRHLAHEYGVDPSTISVVARGRSRQVTTHGQAWKTEAAPQRAKGTWPPRTPLDSSPR